MYSFTQTSEKVSYNAISKNKTIPIIEWPPHNILKCVTKYTISDKLKINAKKIFEIGNMHAMLTLLNVTLNIFCYKKRF